jgi:hypothetical protein
MYYKIFVLSEVYSRPSSVASYDSIFTTQYTQQFTNISHPIMLLAVLFGSANTDIITPVAEGCPSGRRKRS